MIELPEAVNLSSQLSDTVCGKVIQSVDVNTSPHKFAWFHGEPEAYDGMLAGKTIQSVTNYGGLVEISAGEMRLVFGDGVNFRFLLPVEKLPKKHQLHVLFSDETSLVCSVRMYGGLWAFEEGTFDSKYYAAAKEKPSPLSAEFDDAWFKGLLDEDCQKKSVKAFLATEQRIPGLGNGVLQDILFNARIHPKRKMNSLSWSEFEALYKSITMTLMKMIGQGGRNTEKNIFGDPGGYQVLMSSKTYKEPCPVCTGEIIKQAYMGGSVYFCPKCQPQEKR